MGNEGAKIVSTETPGGGGGGGGGGLPTITSVSAVPVHSNLITTAHNNPILPGKSC